MGTQNLEMKQNITIENVNIIHVSNVWNQNELTSQSPVKIIKIKPKRKNRICRIVALHWNRKAEHFGIYDLTIYDAWNQYISPII